MSNPPLLLRADARALPLADASVDLVVTSPPYYALRSYTDGGEHYDGQIGGESTPAAYVQSLLDVTRECMRVLRPGGSIWVNLGDTYSGKANAGASVGRSRRADRAEVIPVRRNTTASAPYKSLHLLPERYRIACVDELGLIARAVVVWSKPNSLPESVTDRVRRSHEDWVHLTKEPRYYAAVDEIREQYSPNKPWGSNRRSRDSLVGGLTGVRKDLANQHTGIGSRSRAEHPLGRLPGSVWVIPTEPLAVPDHLAVDHFAAFPTEWPRRIILGWSPAGGTVLDPFGGTGTTALVAEALGRQGITVDRSTDYCRLAAWRTTDPGQRAKARGLPKPAPVPAGQGDLFDLAGGVTRA